MAEKFVNVTGLIFKTPPGFAAAADRFYLHSRLLCFLLLFFCSQILPVFGLWLSRVSTATFIPFTKHISERGTPRSHKSLLVFYFEKPCAVLASGDGSLNSEYYWSVVVIADPQLTFNPPSSLWAEPNLWLLPGFDPAAAMSLLLLEVNCDHSLKSLHSQAAFPHRQHLSLSSTS